jgi:hypothetical protein
MSRPTIGACPSVEYPGIVELELAGAVVHREVLVPVTVPPGRPARRRAAELLRSERYRREREWAELGLQDYGGEG